MRGLSRVRAHGSLAAAAVALTAAAAGCGGTDVADVGTTATTAPAVAEVDAAAGETTSGGTTPTVTVQSQGSAGTYGPAAKGAGAVGGVVATSDGDDSSSDSEGVYGGAGTDPDGAMAAPARPLRSAQVRTADNQLGTILVDGTGRTLYRFTRDTGDVSTCEATCAGKWPPLGTSGAPTAGGQARSGLLDTTRRRGGWTEVTYAGHPLYRYAGDAAAGDTDGEGLEAFGGLWYVVAPSGTTIKPGG